MTATGRARAGRRWVHGLVPGGLGVLCYSGTVPATRLAAPALGATVATFARIDVAAAVGLLVLALSGGLRVPERRHAGGILASGLGGGLGFPLLVGLAVEHVPASHAAVVVGLTPAATALIAVIRAGERPRPVFWVGCALGLATVVVFAVSQGGGSLHLADLWLLAAVLSTSVAYVEGGRVSRELGSAVMQCWSVIFLAPLATLALGPAVALRPTVPVPWTAWAGVLYVGAVSAVLGAALWYRGLAQGGTARIGQLNLAQPLLSLIWAAMLLHERIPWEAVAALAAVAVSVALCLNTGPRIGREQIVTRAARRW